MINLHPSQIRSTSFIPFMGVFGKTEAEVFAGVLLRVLEHAHAPTMTTPVTVEMLARFEAHTVTLPKSDPLVKFLDNPFLTPDPKLLLDLGYCRCSGSGDDAVWAFTDAGVQRMLDVLGPRGEIVDLEGGAA